MINLSEAHFLAHGADDVTAEQRQQRHEDEAAGWRSSTGHHGDWTTGRNQNQNQNQNQNWTRTRTRSDNLDAPGAAETPRVRVR